MTIISRHRQFIILLTLLLPSVAASDWYLGTVMLTGSQGQGG